jgi:hypothetical protein
MTASELVRAAASCGIQLCVRGNRLIFKAPRGRLTETLRAEITAKRGEILEILRSKGRAQRRVVFCSTCKHHHPSPRLRRPGGMTWEMPGGCSQGLTSPRATPPVYPFTGHRCEGWAAVDPLA